MKRHFLLSLLGFTCFATQAHATLKVDNQVVQSGLYIKAECKPEGVEGFNECACMADVHTPVLTGLGNAEQEKQLNTTFAAMAEKQKCEGRESDTEVKDEPASSNFNYEVTYQSPALLALRFESWAYSGGAHGNGAVGGVIVDAAQGRMLSLNDIFAEKDQPALNTYIHDALAAEPEGEVFHDSIDAFKGVFVTPTECKSCTVVLAEDGLKVVFQTYAVSSFANGPMEVSIPAQYVSYPALKEALKTVKPAAPADEPPAME